MTQKPPADQLVETIIRTTNGFFENTEVWDNMRITLRVTAEFQQFLEQNNDEPSADELSFILGSIQSGIDSFFLVGYTCRSFSGLEESWIPEPRLERSFAEVRTASLGYFSVLIRIESNPIERLGSLLSLIRIQLAFLASYFPWGVRPRRDR